MFIIAIISGVVVLVLLHSLELVEELFFLKLTRTIDLVFGYWVVKGAT